MKRDWKCITLHKVGIRLDNIFLNNFDIFTSIQGKTEVKTIFLIHGYPTSSYDWSKIWDTLSERYQLVAIDLLGFRVFRRCLHPIHILFKTR